MYQAGTLSGNPVAMVAGLRTLDALEEEGLYESVIGKTSKLLSGILAAAKANGVSLCANQVGSMFGLFFSGADSIQSFSDVTACDTDQFNQFFHGMLELGVYLAPSAFEAGFMSVAHSEEDIEATIAAAESVFKRM